MSLQPRAPGCATTPQVTSRARDRHDERTGSDSDSPEREWSEAKRVPSDWLESVLECEEVRYHEHDGVVLLRRGGAIVSVLAIGGISADERGAIEGAMGR